MEIFFKNSVHSDSKDNTLIENLKVPLSRRKFLKLTGSIGLAIIYSPIGSFQKVIAQPNTSFSPANSLDDLLAQVSGNDFVWLDSYRQPSPNPSPFAPPMDDNVLPAGMDGINDRRFGYLHGYTVETDQGMMPQISVSGNSSNLVPYVSVRKVAEEQNLYFVDVLFQTGPDVSSDNVIVAFSQVTGIGDDYERPVVPARRSVLRLDAYPNPSNDRTVVDYVLSRPSASTLRLYNLLGQKVYETDLPRVEENSVPLPLGNLSSGKYFLQLNPVGGVPKTIMIEVLK